MKLCSWCQENPVKLEKNDTCSRSCGSSKRWSKMLREGKLILFKKNELASKKTKASIRLKTEIINVCVELGLDYTPIIAKFYIRARNKGYHNGFFTRDKRARKIG